MEHSAILLTCIKRKLVVITGLENHFLRVAVLHRLVAVLHRFYCMLIEKENVYVNR